MSLTNSPERMGHIPFPKPAIPIDPPPVFPPMQTLDEMKEHPERAANEIFLGNIGKDIGIPIYLRSLKSVRLGIKAYSIYNEPLPDDRPLFIRKSEEPRYETIQVAIHRMIMQDHKADWQNTEFEFTKDRES